MESFGVILRAHIKSRCPPVSHALGRGRSLAGTHSGGRITTASGGHALGRGRSLAGSHSGGRITMASGGHALVRARSLVGTPSGGRITTASGGHALDGHAARVAAETLSPDPFKRKSKKKK